MEHGFFDCGLTGYDWVVENNADVVEVCDLVYSRASRRKSRWVLAVPEDSPVQKAEDLEGKYVATEVVNIVEKYFAEKGVKAHVEFSWGATEVKVPDLVDAIVDLTETGSSLRANKLRIVDTLLETNTKLIANKKKEFISSGNWKGYSFQLRTEAGYAKVKILTKPKQRAKS